MRFASEGGVAVFFSFTSNGLAVKGNEHLHLDEKRSHRSDRGGLAAIACCYARARSVFQQARLRGDPPSTRIGRAIPPDHARNPLTCGA